MATRCVDTTEEVLGDLPRYRVVRGELNIGFDAIRDRFRQVTKKKKQREEVLTLRYASSDKTLRVNGIPPKPAGSYKWVPVHLRSGYAKHKSFFPRGTVLVGVNTDL